MFQPPANQDDLSDRPALKAAFAELWNRQSDDFRFYMGDYVTRAVSRGQNYVDPRSEPASGDAAPVPWNGFPRLLSRFYRDEQSETARARAEEVADVLTPWLYWYEPGPDGLTLQAGPPHQLPFFAATGSLSLEELRAVAKPLRVLNADGSLGDSIPEFRRQQDEYLEWHVDKNDDGSIRRIAFTAEPPDYWEALAEVAPDRVVELYQTHVDPGVQKADLFYPDRVAVFGQGADGARQWLELPGRGGSYNRLNRWTTTDGIMHLTHRANTLGAEVFLAGDASIPRSIDTEARVPGQDPAPEILRIACGSYGGINRSSDPNIGLGVGDLIQAGNRLTLTDPVGLYIASVDLSGLRGPGGEVLETVAGSVKRGEDDPFEPRILRYEVELPEGTDFTLSDCSFENRPLLRGGQIARETTIQLYVNVYPDSADKIAAVCEGQVCRNPDNDQIFGIGGSTCPPAGSPAWLLQTPFDGGDGIDTVGPELAGLVDAGAPEMVTSDEKVHEPSFTGYDWMMKGY